MTPIFQTEFTDPHDPTQRGNCWQACLASLLHCRLEDVPDVRVTEPKMDWFDATQHWLLCVFGRELHIHKEAPPGYAIATGASPRATTNGHAIITFDGCLLHDPHPSGAGLATRETFFTITPVQVITIQQQIFYGRKS